MTLREMALNAMRLTLTDTVKQKYRDWILMAAKEGRSSIVAKVNAEECGLIQDWLISEGLTTKVIGSTTEFNITIYSISVSWA